VVFFVVSFVLFASLVGTYPVVAYSDDEQKQEPVNDLFWDNVATISLDMSYSFGAVSSSGLVSGKAGTTAISAMFILERRNTNGTFTEVDRWSATNGNAPALLITSRTTRNQFAGTYRLSVTARVTRNGKTEIVNADHTATLR